MPLAPASKVVPFATDDQALVRGLRTGEAWATKLLVTRYGPAIERMLRRTLGYERHTELVDLVHEVFVQALGSVHKLKDASALLAWLQRIAAHTAFRTMRQRRARSWLHFREPELMPTVSTEDTPVEAREACRRLYTIVGSLPARMQLLFTLRYVEGLELEQLADACQVSLSTAKRHLAKAESRFLSLASRDAVLRDWVEEGGRWTL